MRSRRLGWFGGLWLVFLATCTVPVQTQWDPGAALGSTGRVVVLPFETRSPFVSEDAIELVSARVFSRLSASEIFDLISPVDVRIWLDRAPGSDRADLVGAFAADAFLRGVVDRFEGRVRADGVAQGPSSVAFELWLEAADGRTLWHGRYAERQQGWIQDLSTLSRAYERGFRWVDPARLASYGAGELISDLIRRVECSRVGGFPSDASSEPVPRSPEAPC